MKKKITQKEFNKNLNVRAKEEQISMALNGDKVSLKVIKHYLKDMLRDEYTIV